MAVLPAGFALPPLPYLLALLVGLGLVGWSLWRLAPAVTAETVLALVPWMAVGSALHALYVLEAVPAVVAPLLGTPSVYATAFIGLGAVWAAAESGARDSSAVARHLGLAGAVAFAAAAAAVLANAPGVAVFWPAVALVAALAVTAAGWPLLRRLSPALVVTGWPGIVVLFAHALDGISTAVGVDVLGFGERTPLARAVMDVGAALPTADLLGVGWLFVVVKLAVAGGVVWLFADLVEDDPREGYLLLAVVAAVGLGPGVHNLLLYAVAG